MRKLTSARAMPTGYLAYRFGDKQKKFALGAYPVVSLAAARKQRDETKALLASGVDPGQQKKANKIARARLKGELPARPLRYC